MIPQTGFEASGNQTYTTRTQEEQLLRRMDAETAATLTIEGRSVLGSPMWCIEIGQGSTILVTANVHPGEPCGRDAALAWFRDMAYSTDQQVVQYLQDHRVVLMPNINIDGSGRPRLRENANGINLNRDYMSLRQPESRAVARVVQRVQPVLLMDMHMIGADGGSAWRPYWNAPHDGHPDLRALGQEYVEEAEDILLDEDYTTLIYASGSIPWAGASSVAAAWHAVGVLNEVAYLSDAEESVHVARVTLDHLTDFHIANRQRLHDARQASLSRVIDGAVTVPTGWRHTETTTVQVDSSSSYEISGTVPSELFDLHGISHDGQVVPLNQPGALMAIYLLDPESSERITNQEDWGPSPEGEPATKQATGADPVAWIRHESELRPVTSIYARHQGQLRPVERVMVKRDGALRPVG